MSDPMVLATQKWLNNTYGSRTGFGSVAEDGYTGWGTINALIRALQIELGITATVNNFGPGTQSRFLDRWPNGIKEQSSGATSTDNVYGIIQGALWCKGYSTGSGEITTHFYAGTGNGIKNLKADAGIDGNSTVDLEIMMALLSMKQFKLLSSYGGTHEVRLAQQTINVNYRDYTGLVPTDGVYGREMNTALIQVLQAIEGYTPEAATGNFGDGTRAKLVTISGANWSDHQRWVWLAGVALVCNRIAPQILTVWSDSFVAFVREFQEAYALPVTGVVDPTTWMSLLTSKGNPNRACTACDTRFEITTARLETLKAAGYKTVGRYLTEPNQEQTDPADYFKAIRPGELQRIVDGGMGFFPIFQEYSTALRHFTPENGARHVRDAREAAEKLGIPPTYIFFAVDFDATDPEVDSHIMPYFRAIRAGLGGGYRVGIYASRNICTRIIDAQFAGRAFVSDMSTGFSGNLGFPIPQAWAYDQFAEISNYANQGWDLDRVAASELAAPVTYVAPIVPGGTAPAPSTDYTKLSAIDLVWHLEKRFSELRAEGRVGEDYIAGSHGGPGTWVTVPTWRCIINYLAKDYLRDGGSKSAVLWSLSAESFRSADAKVLETDPIASKIIAALDRYVGGQRQSMMDIAGEKIDLAHLSATTLGYTNWNLIPDAWTGWAGDLATAMGEIQKIMDWNPNANLDGVAAAMVGHDENYREQAALQGLVLDQGSISVGNPCNRDDLCCDGDAIYLAPALEEGEQQEAHLLSSTLRRYYTNPTALTDRFKRIAWSVGANDHTQSAGAFKQVMTGAGAPLRQSLAKTVSGDVITAACAALAEFIY